MDGSFHTTSTTRLPSLLHGAIFAAFNQPSVLLSAMICTTFVDGRARQTDRGPMMAWWSVLSDAVGTRSREKRPVPPMSYRVPKFPCLKRLLSLARTLHSCTRMFKCWRESEADEPPRAVYS